MVAPSAGVRAVTYERDGHRCVSCGATTHLEYQHRKRVGSGGSKIRPGLPDGVTSCSWCNAGYEGDGQADALRYGWKVRSWVDDAARVPVWYVTDRAWYVLKKDGLRHRVPLHVATEMMVEVYGLAYLEE